MKLLISLYFVFQNVISVAFSILRPIFKILHFIKLQEGNGSELEVMYLDEALDNYTEAIGTL